VREEERTRIAREIHDEFGTILTALKIDLVWLGKRLPADQKSLTDRMMKDLELIQSAIRTVQRISSELRPGILDHLGLAAAIEWQVKEFGNRTGVIWDVSIDVGDAKPDRDISTAVFRILQESLTNIARHAEATRISVALHAGEGLLTLEVNDNGKGVTKEQISDPRSFGIMGLKERVQRWGGDVIIEGIPNKGTSVMMRIPLENEKSSND
jgi:signal transduction histidine kinase